MNTIRNIIAKIREFINKSGLTKVIYLALFFYFLFIGSKILAGAAAGIFIYINFNVLIDMIYSKDKEYE
jgi:hypothetical protein